MRNEREPVDKAVAEALRPEDCLICCLGENNPRYHFEIWTLFRTVNKFGGRIAAAKRFALFVGDVDRQIAGALQRLGVTVRVVQPFDRRAPYANKLRMLELNEPYGMLIAIDCDTVVARDFYDQISPSHVQAKYAPLNPFQPGKWKLLLSRYGLPFPYADRIPYFNSGVVTIPRHHVDSVRAAWGKYVGLLLKDRPGLPRFRPYQLDQIALTLALLEEREVAVKSYPAEMNYQFRHPFPNADPYIIHHHHKTRFGLLRGVGQEIPDRAIHKINSFLRKGE
ncbi:hypothetical protein [Paenibacillus sp. GCM10012303]|uniref:hypothetical protein n=1 Tax=Paenibacillus sp. GCM10012303 TaxID=3317340 RepID=UPI0036161B0A